MESSCEDLLINMADNIIQQVEDDIGSGVTINRPRQIRELIIKQLRSLVLQTEQELNEGRFQNLMEGGDIRWKMES